jgi:hypothetical protein
MTRTREIAQVATEFDIGAVQVSGTVCATSYYGDGSTLTNIATAADINSVSVLTSVNKAAITSINTVVANVSSTMATSINNSNITIAAVSALTSVNLAAITSINTVIDNLDYATSAELATVSSALATSIANYLPLAGGTMTGQLIGTSATFSGAVCATDFYGDGSNLTGISAVVSVNDDVATDATEYPVYVSATGTLSSLKTATTKMTFNPSKGTLTALQMAASNGILLNSFTVSISFDIPTGYNALSAGPIVIDSGVTVTIPTSSTWVVV